MSTPKKFTYIIGLLITLLSHSACERSTDHTIRFGLESAPITLDPRFATDATSYRITRLLYRSLVNFDDNFQFIPDLADWEILTPTHYRFTLHTDDPSGRRFHTGEKLTASDVKATYDYILDITNASPHRSSISAINELKVIDEDTIDFILNIPDPLFPARLVVGIMPTSLIAVDHPFNRHPIGSGRVIFQAWLSDSDLTLKRISDGQILRFLTVKDPTVRILKLLRHELDIIQGDIPKEMLAWLEKKDATHITTKQGNVFTYIGFNMADQFTNQLEIRKAIAHAINRQEIIHHVMGNRARKAGSIFPATHWSGHKTLSGIEFNQAKSRELLNAIGYDKDHPLRLTYKTSNNPFRLRLATIIQHQLKQVNIALDVRSYDWGTFYSDIKTGRFQMYSLSWVGLKTPDIFRYAFHSTSLPPKGANRGRFIDPIADNMIETAESKNNLPEQAIWYQYLQSYLLEQLPYIPLWYEDNVLITAKDISGYQLSSDGNYDSLLNVIRH